MGKKKSSRSLPESFKENAQRVKQGQKPQRSKSAKKSGRRSK